MYNTLNIAASNAEMTLHNKWQSALPYSDPYLVNLKKEKNEMDSLIKILLDNNQRGKAIHYYLTGRQRLAELAANARRFDEAIGFKCDKIVVQERVLSSSRSINQRITVTSDISKDCGTLASYTYKNQQEDTTALIYAVVTGINAHRLFRKRDHKQTNIRTINSLVDSLGFSISKLGSKSKIQYNPDDLVKILDGDRKIISLREPQLREVTPITFYRYDGYVQKALKTGSNVDYRR